VADSRRGSRARLFWGASLATLIAAGGAAPSRAQSLGALMAVTHQTVVLPTATVPAAAGGSSSLSGMAAAQARAAAYATRINGPKGALTLAQQAQAAALAAAKSLDKANSQALNVKFGVTDGLSAHGLAPVANPTTAAQDTTGLNTWQGAAAPSFDPKAPNSVTVVQTASRAVLDWTSFNVGVNTTLTFQQQPSWVALNRVVGASASPATILGSIHAAGTVLILDQNGILFGPTAQVNVGSLIASTLEIGHATETSGSTTAVIGLAQRNQDFLNFGLLGYAEQFPAATDLSTFEETASGIQNGFPVYAPPAGGVTVSAGASLASADGGHLMLLGPTVNVAGQLDSADGEVAVQSGLNVTLLASQGTPSSTDPDVRGLVVTGSSPGGAATDSVTVAENALIQAPRGYVSFGATSAGTVDDEGVIVSTTSISENGYVNLFGQTIKVGPTALISVGPDSSAATIPQDASSLSTFKSSRVRIGFYTPAGVNTNGAATPVTTSAATVTLGSGSLIYAPGANVSIGADQDQNPGVAGTGAAPMTVTVDSGATIDVAGLTDVEVPASRNSIKIDPVKGNELADTPAFEKGFLNGATVYLDPRLSGVTANGVAWVGSPLIAAAAYAQQVGISVSELMIAGGNVTLGAPLAAGGASGPAVLSQSPYVNVQKGAEIDISGGWKTYQAGEVQQTYLVDTIGQVIPISQANPETVYVGVYTGYTVTQTRWGVTQSFVDPLLAGAHYQGQYAEGQDAGSLTLIGSVVALDGQVNAAAFAGPEQILAATPGTNLQSAASAPAIEGDLRALQAAPSQLPASGFLDIRAVGLQSAAQGGDVVIAPGLATDASGPSATNTLYADALNGMELSQLTVQTSGKLTVNAGANVTLAPGGAFEALAGGPIAINGSITAPAGSIDLTTAQLGGSVFSAPSFAPHDFDVVVNGRLDVSGRWVNDFNAAAGQLAGSAWLNGGEITLDAAPRITAEGGATVTAAPVDPADPTNISTTDVSGSILINPGAILDATGGGYVGPTGRFILTAKGGSVSLYDDTTYFEVAQGSTGNPAAPGGIPGFRINGLVYNQEAVIPLNPESVTARVSIAPGAIEDQGFGGGGTFTLTTPAFAFGDGAAATGTELPLNFFSQTGFAAYKITTYKTDLLTNTFAFTDPNTPTQIDSYGGYNAVLQTDVATVAAGQTLSLSQSYLLPVLGPAQVTALQALPTGASLVGSQIVPAAVPTDAWDQKPVSLALGGLTELRVATGALVTGAPGSALTVSQLYNEGDIRLPGGTITQSLIMPPAYGDFSQPLGVKALSDVFASQGGLFMEGDPNALGLASGGVTLTNAQVAATVPIYLLGDLKAGEGVRLAPGSVTDLSGVAVVNPRALPEGDLTITNFTDGKVIDGGALISTEVFPTSGSVFRTTYESSAYALLSSVATTTPAGLAQTLTANPGSVIDLAGGSATFDRPTIPVDPAVAPAPGAVIASNAPTPEWSNGGSLTLNSGGTITGATILAGGGAPQAIGGVLTVLNPILYQADPATPTADAISADTVMTAGFATFIAEQGLSSSGAVTLSLPRSFFLEAYNTKPDLSAIAPTPTIDAGGRLEIDAPYIALLGANQTNAQPLAGASGPGYAVYLGAGTLDVTGAVSADSTVQALNLDATGDIRLNGVGPSSVGLSSPPAPALIGTLQAQGDITLDAAQVYPTTGSKFYITSSAPTGTITIASPGGAAPATPYSAGGDLIIQAQNIVQDGVLRAPLGAIVLGSDTALNTKGMTNYAPGTIHLNLGDGSLTSVSADGLTIPFGVTTDQVEWYFSPGFASPLTAPPAGKLTLAGAAITVAAGATVDLKGGGDVSAYEFVAGPGGTHDVLSQYNSDSLTSNTGCQYPDCRQVYAIVPGLSNAGAAPYDPIYSANYGSLYAPSQAGLSVYLNAAPTVGLAAGWYTLLPAQYALLPGGLRVVQDTGAKTPPPVGGATLEDGTVATSGYFGVAGTGLKSSTLDVFDIQSQAVINSESKIVITTGARYFAALAAHDGVVTPQLPTDAGQLVIASQYFLRLNGDFETAPGETSSGATGRGSEVDISANELVIDPAHGAAPSQGVILTDTQLNSLDASSLLLGGARQDNADGTTSIDATASSLTIGPDATLRAPEIILVTNGNLVRGGVVVTSGPGPVTGLTIGDGAQIIAAGAVTDEPTGAYVVDGLETVVNSVTGLSSVVQYQNAQGAFLRVSNGPERLLTRLDVNSLTPAAPLVLGAATLSTADGAVELDSLGALTVSDSAKITTTALAVAAGAISFGAGGAAGTLDITQKPKNVFGAAATLTLRSQTPITFAAGDYGFDNLTLDAPALAAAAQHAGRVDLTASGTLTLADSGAAAGACASHGCGTATLALSGATINFSGGTLDTLGFGGGVTLAAPSILAGAGVGALNAGSAPLTLATSFVGDAGSAVAGATIPGLTFTTTGAVKIAGAAPASNFKVSVGTPGSALSIYGGSVAIVGTELRATAGALTVEAQSGGIEISGGAVLATPAFVKTFGDSVTPDSQSAPGGLLSLTALAGDIDISDDSSLSIGSLAGQPGTMGTAGKLSLVAQNGQISAYDAKTGAVALSNVVNTGVLVKDDAGDVITAPLTGATFNLDTGQAFDLSSFAAPSGVGRYFGGGITVRTGSGALTLAAGDTLAAASVSLTANDPATSAGVIVAGTIDTTGVNGGAVSLYGAGGVHLTSTALVDAEATGYESTTTPTLQAKGGAVTLGVTGAGAITIDAGAKINVTADYAAADPGGRLVEMNRSTGTSFTYVDADQGGTVTFRAPVVSGPAGSTVDVAVAGALVGDIGVMLQGYRTWNLTDLASNPAYVGVTIANDTATLDLSKSAPGAVNALGVSIDSKTGVVTNGPIVDFIQNFAKSVSIPTSLASLANFHAQPGVELDYSGNIVLNSNWNLGAGVLKGGPLNAQNPAVLAGLLTPDPDLPGQYTVLAADPSQLAANEAALLSSQYMDAIYRVGGDFAGEPGSLTLRAQGNLTLNGSITDGFFQFADQTDPRYLAAATQSNTVNQGVLSSLCIPSCSATPSTWSATGAPSYYLLLQFPSSSTLGIQATPVAYNSALLAPYSAMANSPAALGSMAGRAGDPLGGARLFPLLPGGQAISSWSYQLVAGSAAGANPLATQAGGTGALTVQGYHPYSYGAQAFTTTDPLVISSLDFGINDATPDQWASGIENQFSSDSATIIDLSGAPLTVQLAIPAILTGFAAAYPSDGYKLLSNEKISVSLSAADDLLTYISANFDSKTFTSNYALLSLAKEPWQIKDSLNDILQAYAAQNPGAIALADGAATVALTPGSETGFISFLDKRYGSAYPLLNQSLVSTSYAATTNLASTYDPSITAQTGASTTPVSATAGTLVRTGDGSIALAASGAIDLSNDKVIRGYTGPSTLSGGQIVPVSGGAQQLGGAAIYTAGQIANLGMVTATDFQASGGPASYLVDLSANAQATDYVSEQTSLNYSYGAQFSFPGFLIVDPVYAHGGGSVSLAAGGSVLGRRDTLLENTLGGYQGLQERTYYLVPWVGSSDQPWETGSVGATVNGQINPQLFQEGIGTLAGGDISVHAGQVVSDISIVSADSLTTANVYTNGLEAASSAPVGQALAALGGGGIAVVAGAGVLGGRLDVASGDATIQTQGAVVSAGQLQYGTFNAGAFDNSLRVLLSDGTVSIQSDGNVSLQGLSALSPHNGGSINNDDDYGFYGAGAGVSIRADGGVAIANIGYDVIDSSQSAPGQTPTIYPGAFEAVALTGGINISTSTPGGASEVLLYPQSGSPLTLLAAGDIGTVADGVTTPTVIAQLDSDPTLLPGAFTQFSFLDNVVSSGLTFAFPAVLPNTTNVLLTEYHNANPTHAGDARPDTVMAGGSVLDLTLSVAERTDVTAGGDILNMVFLGQNLAASDITRIAAGRDITATTLFESPIVRTSTGAIATSATISLPAVQGDTFILGGPGALFVEAGRDAGPFLNSAVTDGYVSNGNGGGDSPTGVTTYGGGVITVGNLWNPFLPSTGASIFTEFGVANGEDFQNLITTYLDPALPANASALANAAGYLFLQTTSPSDGAQTPIRAANTEIYALSLLDWEKSIAADVISRYDTTNGAATPPASAPPLIQFMEGLRAGGAATFAQAYAFLPQLSDRILPLDAWLLLNDPAAAALTRQGTQDLTFTQDMSLFTGLDTLHQQTFLISDVYFNELIQTSIPGSPSYLDYSRGYKAVNALFPASMGYTADNLSGTAAQAPTLVKTGNLDLRLATIQTEEGGNIAILGPGGQVLAGSTVATADQAGRRVYAGGELYAGGQLFQNVAGVLTQSTPLGDPFPSAIASIPAGYEGVLTLRGGSIDSFTDGDFLLNQSRAFTEQGGDIALWSSNADVNAGQGPRTTADVPPVEVRIDQNGYSQVSTTSAVSGAGVGAFQADAQGLAPDVFLIAPHGTVDAGDAGVRSAGNVFIAAFQVANADAIQAQGAISGAGGPAAVNVAAQTSGDAAASAAAQAAQSVARSQNTPERPLILVDVLGFLADESDTCSPEDHKKGKCY
jgi:filamentous hemagglutinin family protein